jgi:hypothetical protein
MDGDASDFLTRQAGSGRTVGFDLRGLGLSDDIEEADI